MSGVSLELIFFFHTPTVIKKIKYPFRRPILKISGVSLELIFFFKTSKTIEPGKSHVGVSESFLI